MTLKDLNIGETAVVGTVAVKALCGSIFWIWG